MRDTRRWPIPVVVVLVLAMAAPAAAGVDCSNPKFADKPQCQTEPPPPDDGPAVVDVTMALVDGEGLTTDCADGDGIAGSIEMIADGTGLSPVRDPVLGVHIDGVEWWRVYEDPIWGWSGTGFDGCHRMTLDPEEEAVYGGLMIGLDGGGAVTSILWHFDYFYRWGERPNGRTYLAVYEHFTLSGSDLTWVDATPGIDGDTNGTLTGTFGVTHHLEDRDTRESIGYAHFTGSPRELSIRFVAEPRS